MSAQRRTALQRMDALVRWSNASEMVKRDMSDDVDGQRRYRSMRWLPLVPIACGAGLVVAAIAAPFSSAWYVVASSLVGMVVAIPVNGPLGKPSADDDEGEAAVRKEAFLFCFAVLALVNILGGPILMVTGALRGWAIERIVGIACAIIIGNLTWFCALPTLYASWKSPKSAEE